MKRLIGIAALAVCVQMHAALKPFTCEVQVAKGSCWYEQSVNFKLFSNDNKAPVAQLSLTPEQTSSSPVSFPCQPADQLSMEATFDPPIWDADKGKVYKSSRYWEVPAVLPSNSTSFLQKICFPNDFFQVPKPLTDFTRCGCVFSVRPTVVIPPKPTAPAAVPTPNVPGRSEIPNPANPRGSEVPSPGVPGQKLPTPVPGVPTNPVLPGTNAPTPGTPSPGKSGLPMVDGQLLRIAGNPENAMSPRAYRDFNPQNPMAPRNKPDFNPENALFPQTKPDFNPENALAPRNTAPTEQGGDYSKRN